MVERGEGAGQVIGLGVGRRAGGGEAELRRRHGQRRQQGHRLELADGRGMLAVAGGEAVAQEEHVELGALGGRGDVLHQREIGPAGGDGVGMPPAADMMARRLHEHAEPHFTSIASPPPASVALSLVGPAATSYRVFMEQSRDDVTPVVEPGSPDKPALNLRALQQRIRQQEILASLGVMALHGASFDELLDSTARMAAEGLRAEFSKCWSTFRPRAASWCGRRWLGARRGRCRDVGAISLRRRDTR